MKSNYKRKLLSRAISLATALTPVALLAQDDTIDEIVVVGSQIRGAQISEVLPVSVLSEQDIEALGVNSGDELLEFMAEQGQNFFSESENISGGVNSARGDIGAFNLRNLGTGNTLVLLNGRRMVNSAAYQTEEVGGSFVPVNTVNVQSLPVTGLRRAEVLREGASAIYGADAVAGVVNYVLKNDFEGFRVNLRSDAYESIGRQDERFTLQWGTALNDGATQVGAFFNYYQRDRVNSQDDPRWANSDYSSRVAGTEFAGTIFRNDSANSAYGQYDIRPSVSKFGISGKVTDSAGEFETYPAGSPQCQYSINDQVCGAVDGQGTYRYNLNENRDLYSELARSNFYAYANHNFDNGIEAFSELTWYYSDTNTIRHASTPSSAVGKLRIAADAYYNPFGACGSPNRLPDSVIGTGVPCSGLQLELDNYRVAQVPRIVDVDGDTYRFVGGLRGSVGEWDWEGAYTWSRADRNDTTHNRVSNSLLQEALNDTTSAGFNPFAPTTGSNIERALVDVVRLNEQELTMVDFKVSNPSVYELPAGGVGFLAGVEYRDESFSDIRDPRLNGTIAFVDSAGVTFPYVSDVMNSSPSASSFGDRQVTSLFTEIAVPVLDNLDVQMAIRYEDFSDVGSTTVGKVAFGYRVIEPVLIRGSWSEAFRAPNLVTINEALVARSNTTNDPSCLYVDPTESVLDCSYGVQRTAQGSAQLQPETSDNTSLGLVIEPIEGLTLTYDRWRIEKDNTIGLFGEENHIALDLLRRLSSGASNCSAVTTNSAVVRDTAINPDALPLFAAAGLCPFGDVARVEDNYANLDTRTVEGYDIGIYYEVDSSLGSFSVRYVGSFLDSYDQEAGGFASELVEAKASGILPQSLPVVGFSSLVRQNGNADRKDTVRASWDKGDWGVNATALRNGDFFQVLSNGREWAIPSMTTANVSVDYNFELLGSIDSRIRFGANNVTDERAPLADDSFGYFADQHSDLGRFYYVDLRFDL